MFRGESVLALPAVAGEHPVLTGRRGARKLLVDWQIETPEA